MRRPTTPCPRPARRRRAPAPGPVASLRFALHAAVRAAFHAARKAARHAARHVAVRALPAPPGPALVSAALVSAAIRSAALGSAALLSAALVSPARADTLTLANGDRITGKFAGFDGETLSFDTDYAGTLKVAAGSVAGLATDGIVTLRRRPPEAGGGIFGGPVGRPGGAVETGRLAPSPGMPPHAARPSAPPGGATLRVAGPASGPGAGAGAGAAADDVKLADIAEMRPGTELPHGLQWSGHANFGGTRKAGNTESNRVHVDADAAARGDEDRLTFRGVFNREIADGTRTEDNFLASAQHDHFVAEKLFFYTNGKLERDEPADLRLRTTVGTGVGYQVYETPTTYLSVEAGPSYTHEELMSDSDRDYVSGRWALDFHHGLRAWLVAFHRHELLFDVENTDDFRFDSSTGLRFPLGDGFQATAQFDLKYDSQPAASANRTDRVYLLTIGYAW